MSFKLFKVCGHLAEVGWPLVLASILWMNCVPSETYVEVLTPSTCECDLFWK